MWSALRKDTSWEHWGSNAKFPFFKLSPELRNKIYEMIFQYPKSGVKLSRNSNKATLATRSMSENVSRYDDEAWKLTTLPLQKILSPLALSREFYREALPFFYSLNHFVFRSPVDMLETLSKMPDRHFEHVVYISFDVDGKFGNRSDWSPGWDWDVKYCKKAYELLRMMENLRRLDVYLDEIDWMARYPNTLVGKLELRLPAISALGRIRGLEQVNFIGCPSLEGRFKEKMLMPRESEGEASKKRKETENEDDSEDKAEKVKKNKAAKRKRGAKARWYPGL